MAAHDHHHAHDHAPRSFGRAFAIGTALNLGFVVVEAVYGVLAGSTALLADAGHNASDVLGLLIAWAAATLGRRSPGGRYTYGFRSSTIVAALINALLLVVAILVISAEAVRRFGDPAPVAGGMVMAVAAVGIVVNTATALMFMSGRRDDININGAFLHMAADAAVSAGVVVAGFLIVQTGAWWIDPATSLVIVAVIAASTWGLLRDAVAMCLHAAPRGVDPDAIAAFLREQPGVEDLHDLHVWPMSTTETALTVHLLVPGDYPGDAFTAGLAKTLKARFGVDHATIQVETDPAVPCELGSAACV